MNDTITHVLKKDGYPQRVSYDKETYESITIDSDTFLTESEIIEDIVSNRMRKEDKEYIKSLDESDLIKLHLSLGMWIRNTYGLWLETNPVLGKEHPDDISQEILKGVWVKVNDEYSEDS